MSEPHSLNQAVTGLTAERRDRLAERARRAGCGVLHIDNSTQELLALMTIGKAAREARAEMLRPNNSTPMERQQDIVLASVLNSLDSQNTSAKATFTARDNLLESMLRTSGRVVRRES